MDIDGLEPAGADDRVRAEAAGLPVPPGAPCWAVRAHGRTLAWVVVLDGSGERRVRSVAAGDPSDPEVAEAVVASREAVIGALARSGPA